MDRTWHWWSTRIELVIGAAALGVGLLAYGSMPGVMVTEPNPQGNLIVLAGLVGLATGLLWMIRVFRGPHDPPSTWRYRDR